MYGTLQTLVDMLESSDADGGASGGETEETIDKIMSLVNKMVDEDESGDVSGMPEPPARSTPGSGKKISPKVAHHHRAPQGVERSNVRDADPA